jgi:hypothetical protein
MRFVPLVKSCPQAKQCVRAESLAAPHIGQKSVDIVMSILLPEKSVRLLFFSAVYDKKRRKHNSCVPYQEIT